MEFGSKYLEIVEKTGIIFEGSSLYNDVIMLPPKPVEKTLPVHHIYRGTAPVELPWFST
jgi:hypothetical protein